MNNLPLKFLHHKIRVFGNLATYEIVYAGLEEGGESVRPFSYTISQSCEISEYPNFNLIFKIKIPYIAYSLSSTWVKIKTKLNKEKKEK